MNILYKIKDSRCEISSLSLSLSGALIGVNLLFGIVLASSTALADDSIEANVAVSVPVSCLMTSTVDSTHSANVNAGTYRADIGKTTFKVMCNENSGFSIYAIGYSNEEYGNNKLLATVGGELSPTYDIVTGTAESGNTSNWAMKLNAVSGTYTPSIENGYDSYSNVPTTYTKVATFNSSTDATIGASIEATYAAYIASDQPAGTYNGKVKYTMVHPASEVPTQPQTTASGKICYYANVSDYEGTMSCQNVTSSAILKASNFSRNGYGFAGWSDAFDYETNTSAHFYGPQELITIPDTSIYTGEGKGLSLYAVWVKGEGNLQDWSSCSNLTKANEATNIFAQSITALSDSRDNNTYAVARLADGNCWMIENLRLDDSAILTIANTNNPLNNGTTVTLKHNYADTNTYNTLSPSSSESYDADTAPNGWCNDRTSACEDQSRLRADNTFSRESMPIYTYGKIYSFGNYYNWYSATAGRGVSDKTSGNTIGDLCPAGWALPTGDDNGDYYVLNTVINGGRNNSIVSYRSFPNNFILSGSTYGNYGENGYYWTSTAGTRQNEIGSYALRLEYYYDQYVSPGTEVLLRSRGNAIRCITNS